ncbi:HET-domain-containing protein [Thozetella sp. PMI_491]|nr:HET-domain-containing protein [Thozetella sp. PMI_491]
MFRLGSLGQIRRRNCPVCTLVTTAVEIVEKTEDVQFLHSQEIGLYWRYVPTYSSNCWDLQLVLLDKGPLKGVSLGFVHNPPLIPPRPSCYCLREARPIVDYERLLRWLSDCELSHGTCYEGLDPRLDFPSAFPGLEIMRLIDVKRACIVEKERLCRYVALSYVWGSVSTLGLSNANKTELMKTGALHEAWDMLPRTIQDAICLVERLGETYLWVDALCLIQNDDKDKQAGIGVMNLIYEKAIFTIAAASGPDANAGLPGVQPGSRTIYPQTQEVLPGLHLTIYRPLGVLLESTSYSTRAWTFQEQILSSRVLYFVDGRIYFRCYRGIISENCLDSVAFNLSASWYSEANRNASMRGAIQRSPKSTFMYVLHAYTRRSMTDQNDAIRAMTGIMRRYSQSTGHEFFQGMPASFLDGYLLFSRAQFPLERREAFPSYSWAGWTGSVIFLDQIVPHRRPWELGPSEPVHTREDSWDDECTWIVWYTRDPQGRYERIPPRIVDRSWTSSHATPITDDNRKREYFALAFSLGNPPLDTIPSQLSVMQLEDNVPKAKYPMLEFWTVTAVFELSDTNGLLGTCSLVDADGQKCGRLAMDGSGETNFFDGELFEVALLSIGDIQGRDWGTSYFVICLKWDQGVAQRRGIGHISAESVVRSLSPGPMWKEITLA